MAAPILAGLIRALAARGGATAARKGAGSAAARSGGKKAAGGIAPSPEWFLASQGKAPKSPAGKPDIDFGKLIANMGRPQARQEAEQEATEKDLKRRVDEDEMNSRQRLVDGIKGVTKGFVGLFTALFVVPPLVKRWTESLTESRRQLQMYNGRIAASIARLDVQKIRQDIQFAGRTGVSTAGLMDVIGEFNESFQPVREDMRTVMNTAGTVVVKAGALLADAASAVIDFMPGARDALDALEEDRKRKLRDEAVPVHRFLRDLADPKRNLPDQLPPL